MVWALLVGNTRVVAGLVEGGSVRRKVSVPALSVRASAGAAALVRKLRSIGGPKEALVASVVPQADPHLRKALQKGLGKVPKFVDHRNAGIPVRVDRPTEVGADRLANAVAGRALFGAPVLVLDYGTGTTLDVVDRHGAYCGGAILPGLGLSLRALHEFTAKIPKVPFEPARRAVGRNTRDAVRSGVYYGAIGATRELLLRTRKEMGAVAPAVATGGWSGIFEGLHLFHAIDPDLTLKGLGIIWERVKKKK